MINIPQQQFIVNRLTILEVSETCLSGMVTAFRGIPKNVYSLSI